MKRRIYIGNFQKHLDKKKSSGRFQKSTRALPEKHTSFPKKDTCFFRSIKQLS